MLSLLSMKMNLLITPKRIAILSSNGIDSSATNLQGLTEAATWLAGQCFAGNISQAEVANWLNSLNLPALLAADAQQ